MQNPKEDSPPTAAGAPVMRGSRYHLKIVVSTVVFQTEKT